MIARADIVAEARAWIGTPYHHQASRKGVGADCIGLVRGVARAVGLDDPFDSGKASKFAGYSGTPNPQLLIEACEQFMDRIDITAALPGDVPVFRFLRDPQHFGIISASNPRYVVHSYMQAQEVVENRIDGKWASRIVAMYRLRGVEP